VVTVTGNRVEIKPMNQSSTISETLVMNIDERKIASVHIMDPSRVDKYAKLLINFRKMYNYNFFGMLLEIVTTPTKESLSMKTITYGLVYTNTLDMNSDFNKILTLI